MTAIFTNIGLKVYLEKYEETDRGLTDQEIEYIVDKLLFIAS